jgi:DNA (cytosine-5)-methyltransferase 1
MIRYIDLFAGIGGIRIGATQALHELGFKAKCVLSSEIDEKACQTYMLNFGETPSGDIHKIDEIPEFDLLLGGFPCQPFSYAGKQMGFGDTRGTLFFEIERILNKYRPKAFLLENVRGLTTHDKGRTFATITKALTDLGYGIKTLVLNSSEFNVPQNRTRLYIIGLYGADPVMHLKTDLGAADSHRFKKELSTRDLFESAKKYSTVKDILETKVDSKYYCSEKFTKQLKKVIGDDLSKLAGYRLIDYRGGKSIHSWEMGKNGECTPHEIKLMNLLITNRRKPEFGKDKDGKKLTLEQIGTFYEDNDLEEVVDSLVQKGYLKNDNGKYNPVAGNMSFEVFKFLDPNSVSITLTSSDCNRLGIVQNNIPRRITPRECARLQGFPETFIINPSDEYAYKQFGNSVSVPVIKAVLKDFIQSNIDKLGWGEPKTKESVDTRMNQSLQDILAQDFQKCACLMNYKNLGDICGQKKILSLVKDRDNLNISEVADILGVSKGTVSELTDKLVDKGLITKERKDTDQRITVIKITNEGEQMLAKEKPISNHIVNSAFNKLNEQEKKRLHELLQKMIG